MHGTNPFSAARRWLPGRPALIAAGLLCVGIGLHPIVWRNPPAWLIVVAMLVLGVCLLINRPRWMMAWAAGAVLSAGILLGQIANYQFRPNQIGLFAADEPRLAWLELQFSETPRLIESSSGRHVPPRQMGNASVVAVKTHKGWETASGEIQFSIGQAEPRISAGQRVRVVGMLQRPAPATNPGEFDWEQYCRSQRVLASIRVNHSADIEVMSGGVAPTLAEARVGVREWLAAGFYHDHAVDLALLQALLLGDRSPDARGVARDFQRTGTSHLLSSSGVRMAVLAGMIYFLCRLVRAGPRVSLVVVMLSILGWGSVTLFTPQGLRPVIIGLLLGIALCLRRKVDALQLLCLAAMAILICRPLDMYSAGFQFSFVLVLGMLVFTSRVAKALGEWSGPDIEALHRFGKLTAAQLFRRTFLFYFRQTLTTALVAWVISIPLVAYHFEQFTPWAVPISIVLSPVVLAVLGVGFFKLVATMLVPSLAPTWATIATWPVEILRRGIGLAARLPLADMPVPRPPVWAIFLFYGLLCLPLLPAPRQIVRRCLHCGPVCAIVLLLPWLMGFAGQSALPGTVRVTLLSIGAGQCGVVEPPGGGALMVDAGSSTVSDPWHLTVWPFLHHEGKRSLQTIYLSHGDYDHISATQKACEEYGVSQVFTTPFFRKHADESPFCRNLLEYLDGSGLTPREAVAGQSFEWGGAATAEVLWPTKQCNMNSNNAGMVIRLTYGGKSILFPADIQDPAMYELLKTPAKLRSDVLVAAHHGSSEALTTAFVRAVNPEVIISSDATRLTKKQRDFEGMIDHRPLYRTSRCGAITIEIDRNGRLRVTPFLTRKQKGIIVEKDGTVHMMEK